MSTGNNPCVAIARAPDGSVVHQLHLESFHVMGALAGGAAHDLNNILTAILGNLSLAQLHERDNDKVRAKLKEAERAGMRARALAERLLSLGHKQQSQLRLCSIVDLMRQVMVQTTKDNITVSEHIAQDVPTVMGDHQQLSLLLRNLAENAVEAMAEGGEIHISVESSKVQDTPGVRLVLRDHGHSIPAETLPRIFVPFFSTRHKERGLGLTACCAITANHAGLLEVQPHSAGGTTASVWLPLGNATTPPHREGLRILLHEPESIVAHVAQHLLREAGYDVIIVETLSAAEEQLQTASYTLAILTVADQAEGAQAAALTNQHPDLLTITTGPARAADPGQGHLSRPYDVSDLLALVDATLLPTEP